jgi:PKD domain
VRHLRITLACGLVATLAAVVALPESAGAVVGRIGATLPDVPSAHHGARTHAPRATSNLAYSGGPVMHSNRAHIMFWAPAGSNLTFEPGYQALIERFLAQVAADSHSPANVYGLSGQYHDAFGPAAYDSTYAGAVTDTAPLPPNGCREPPAGPSWDVCMTDDQLQSELQRVVSANHLPGTQRDVYFIVTPNGLGDCIDASSSSCALGGSGNGYCGYHSQTMSGLLYAVIPYNAVSGHCQSDNPRPNSSAADPTISTISHEHNEIVTDPQEDAWIDQMGQENGDLCIQNFGPVLGGSGQSAWNEVVHGGHYFLQEEWSNEDGGCAARAKPDSISFSGPARAQSGKRMKFVGRASAGHGSIVAYDWFFGDGVGGHGRTATHIYRRPGSYRVVLRTTNSSANWTVSARTIRITKAQSKRRGARR